MRRDSNRFFFFFRSEKQKKTREKKNLLFEEKRRFALTPQSCNRLPHSLRVSGKGNKLFDLGIGHHMLLISYRRGKNNQKILVSFCVCVCVCVYMRRAFGVKIKKNNKYSSGSNIGSRQIDTHTLKLKTRNALFFPAFLLPPPPSKKISFFFFFETKKPRPSPILLSHKRFRFIIIITLRKKAAATIALQPHHVLSIKSEDHSILF